MGNSWPFLPNADRFQRGLEERAWFGFCMEGGLKDMETPLKSWLVYRRVGGGRGVEWRRETV